MTRRRTYWHLGGDRRIPSRYEVVSSKLLRHPDAGLEVRLPFGDWYSRFQKSSLLQSPDPDSFRDPRETTYTSYIRLQAARAVHVDMLFDGMDPAVAPGTPWSTALCDLLAPALYPLHGLQMVSGYLGQLAPSGRLAILFLFQSADLTRRIECSARSIHRLSARDPSGGSERQRCWEEEPAWQPLRRAIEKLLVTWDWGESFAATNLVLLPLFPPLLDRILSDEARAAGESGSVEVFRSLGEDLLWQLEWTASLVRFLGEARQENIAELGRWTEAWRATCEECLVALLAERGDRSAALTPVLEAHRLWLEGLGLA